MEKTVRRENGKILKQVQDDMEMSRHCERMRSNPANYLARSADKNLLGCSRLTGLRLTSAMTSSFRRQTSPSARNPLSLLTFHFSQHRTLIWF